MNLHRIWSTGTGSGYRRAKRTLTNNEERGHKTSRFEELDVLFLGLAASPVAWMSFMEA
jgi:hypothetical protein